MYPSYLQSACIVQRTYVEALEWVMTRAMTGDHIAIIVPTSQHAHAVASALLAVSPPAHPVRYLPLQRRLLWGGRGVPGGAARILTSEQPDLLRGWRFAGGWCLLPSAWHNAEEMWSNYATTLIWHADSPTVITETE